MIYGCKTKSFETKKLVSLSQVYKKAYDLELIEKDPIIVIDDKTYGILSKIDTTDIKFKGLNISSIGVIPKNNIHLKKYFGEDSKRGIISIKKHYKLICDGRIRKTVFISDNKLTSLQEMIDNANTKYYLVGSFSNALDDNNIDTEIIILTTDKVLRNKIIKNKK